ncbi:MAG: potassium channel family protein [Fusobacteriaceae bacterium]
MNIVITGDRNEIYFLIKSFIEKGHNLTYINKDSEICRKISRIYEECNVLCGDPTNPNILEEAELYSADLLIASGEHDPDNLIVCQIAKKLYSTEKTLAIVNDPNNINIFKILGVDIVVSTTNTIFSIIEKKLSVEEINNIINMEEQKVSIVEILINENNSVIGKKILALELPKSSLIGCILRKEKAIIPRGDTVIEAFDKLVVITLDDVKKTVLEMLSNRSTL